MVWPAQSHDQRSESQAAKKTLGARPARIFLAVGILAVATALGARMITSRLGMEPPTDSTAWPFELCRILLAIVGFVLIGIYTFWRARNYPRRNYVRTFGPSLRTESQIAQAFVERVLSMPTLSSHDAWLFAQQLVQPSLTRGRVEERISIERHLVRRCCTVQLRSPAPQSDEKDWRELLPVARFLRGRVIPDLHISSLTGEELASLPHDQFMTRAGLCIRTMLADCINTQDVMAHGETAAEYVLLQEALIGMCVKHVPLEGQQSIAARAELLRNNLATVFRRLRILQEDQFSMVCALACQLQVSFAVVVPVTVRREESVTVNYEYTEPLISNTPSGAKGPVRWSQSVRMIRRRVFNWCRQALDYNLPEVYISAARARSCDSYHLTVEAPPGSYVAESWFFNEREETRESVSRLSRDRMYEWGGSHSRVSPPSGRSETHVYTRSFGSSSYVAPWLYARFAERPLGSLGRALLVGVGVTSTIWVIGVHLSMSHERIALDLGALLFAVPLSLIAVLGWSAAERGYSGTLAGQGFLLGSAALALSALLALQLSNADRLEGLKSWPAVVMVTEPAWIVLLVSSLALNVWGAALLAVRWVRWQRDVDNES